MQIIIFCLQSFPADWIKKTAGHGQEPIWVVTDQEEM